MTDLELIWRIVKKRKKKEPYSLDPVEDMPWFSVRRGDKHERK